MIDAESPAVAVFDGTKSAVFSHDYRSWRAGPDVKKRAPVYLVSSAAEDAQNSGYWVRPYGISYETALLSALVAIRNDASAFRKVVVRRESEGTAEQKQLGLTAIEMHAHDDGIHTYLVDPAEHYIVKRYTLANKKGQVTAETGLIEYNWIDGLPIPSAVTWASYGFGTKEDSPKFREVNYKLVSAVLDSNEIPDSLFETSIPDDAAVWDRDAEIWSRDPRLIQQSLDDVVIKHRSRRWLIIGNVLLIVAFLMVFGFRKIRNLKKGSSF